MAILFIILLVHENIFLNTGVKENNVPTGFFNRDSSEAWIVDGRTNEEPARFIRYAGLASIIPNSATIQKQKNRIDKVSLISKKF
jgi:hypothetical protein